MKVTLKLEDISKEIALDKCLMSCESKQIGNDTYLWYYAKKYAMEDLKSLTDVVKDVKYVIYPTWDIDGFFSIEY